MATLEYCQIELIKNVKRGLFGKTSYHWEAHKITPTGKEILYTAEEFSLTYSGDPVSMKNNRIKEKETHEEVVRFLITQGWEPSGSDEKGQLVTMTRPAQQDAEQDSPTGGPVAASELRDTAESATPPEAPNKGTIKYRLETLKEVYEAGLISDEEYALKRSEVLKDL